jgi:hypothetical protein
MRLSMLWFAIMLFAVENSWGQSAPSTRESSPERTYTLSRWDEDYSFLADPAQRTDFWDPIKYVPLNATGDWYANFGGQVRDRYEYFNNNTFGTGPQTRDGYNDARLTENMDLHFGSSVRVFVQGDSAFETGRNGGPRPNDRDELDLEQGFADLKIPFSTNTDFTLRAGRQFLEFGAARLIGPADFSNVRKTFDGFRGNLDSPDNSLTLFLVRPVLVEPYRFDSSDSQNVLAGVYDTLQLPKLIVNTDSKLELYELYLDRQATSFVNETGTGTEDRYTTGVRLTTNPKPFDFDVEADYQHGEFSGHDISAFQIATKDGFAFYNVDFTPRIFLGADVASGSTRTSGGEIGTFNQLYPSGHGQFGNIDAIGRQNIIDVESGLDLTLLEHRKFVESLKLRTSFYEFWRESTHDAVYTSSGSILRAAGTSDARHIGSELDLLLNWQIDPHLSAYMGYSHMFAGSFISQTGPSNDINFFYTALTYTF